MDAPKFTPRRPREAPDPQAKAAFLAGVATQSTELQPAPVVATPALVGAAPAVAPEAATVAEVAPAPAVTLQAAPKAPPKPRMTRSGKRLIQQNVRLPEDLAAAYRKLCDSEDVTMQDDILRMVKARVKAASRQ